MSEVFASIVFPKRDNIFDIKARISIKQRNCDVEKESRINIIPRCLFDELKAD